MMKSHRIRIDMVLVGDLLAQCLLQAPDEWKVSDR